MKKINFIITIIISLVSFLTGCNKDQNLIDENNKWVYLDSANSANVKFLQVFAGNTPQLPTAPNATTGPQVFIYANGKKLNGTSLGYGSVWPTTAVYANIPSGSTRFDIVNARLNLSVVPNLPGPIAGDTLTSFTATVDKGKFYSFYIGDTVPNVRITMKEDLLPPPAYQKYKIRLANFIMNPLDTLTLFSRRQNAEIISNISHKIVSDWVELPLPVINDTMELRKKGSATTYITAIFGSTPPILPTGMRMYTVLARGKTGVTAKTPASLIITNR